MRIGLIVDSTPSPVVSSIPGRLRLRLRRPARLEQLRQTLATWPEVREVRANPATGSLLLSYDAAALPQAQCVQRCEAALAALMPATQTAPTPSPATEPAPTARPRSARARAMQANRLAKRGMLASLAASLLLAATGAGRGHIWTGLFFLHALGMHLWVHRRNLIR
jgi:hypothetical protein